jgi:hypothetical protein
MSIRFILVAAAIIGSCAAQNAGNSVARPCSEAQQKQFDFWIGEWDLSWPAPGQGPAGHGTNSVKEIMDGCVVQENFSGASSMPLRGMSLSRFDPRSGKWKQTWVDNQGGYIDLVGEFNDGQMILSGKGLAPSGNPAQVRMVYKNIKRAEFDWSWERSLDGGKTWQVIWPIHYKRRLGLND